MFNKLLLAVLLCNLAATIIGFNFDAIPKQYQQTVQKIWQKHNKGSARMQLRDEDYDCILAYEITCDGNRDSLKSSYDNCNLNANAAKTLIDSEGAEKRASFEKRGDGVCDSIHSCSTDLPQDQFLQCYTTVNSANSIELFQVSTESKTEHQAYTAQQQKVADDNKACKATGYNDHMQGTMVAERDLDSCLQTAASAK